MVERPPDVQVIATTAEGTRSALAAAKRLVSPTDAPPIVLLVPQIISAATLREGPDQSARATERYRDLARTAGVEAIVRLCHCRSHRDVFSWMLGRPSLIVIGGRRRWWWPTTAQRMASELERAGHAVVFAEVS